MDDVPERPLVDREKTCPFLLRTFVKVGGFHRINLFEENALPIVDEHQLFTWKDATLRELVTSLRALPPNPLTPTLRHPAARFQFRIIYADPNSRGRITSKDIGQVYAKDLVDFSSLNREDSEYEPRRRPPEERTLDYLRIVAGDWLSVSVILPTKISELPGAPGLSIRGGAATNGIGRGGSDMGWAGQARGGGGGGGGGLAPPRGRWGHIADPDPAPTPAPANNWRGAPRGVDRGGFGRGGGMSHATFASEDRGRVGPPTRDRDRGYRRGSPDRGADRDRPRGGGGRSSRRSKSMSMSRSRSRSRNRSPPRRRDRR